MLQAYGRYIGARGAASKSRPDLIFRWAIAIEGKIHEAEVCVRADNAAERGVPFPTSWMSELGLRTTEPTVDVDALADSAVRRACEELSLPKGVRLNCRLCLCACTPLTATLAHERCMCAEMSVCVARTWQVRWSTR